MAGSNIVVCKYCKNRFDKTQEPWVKISTRYAHESCYEKALKEVEKEEKEKKSLEALEQYIMKIYDVDYIPPFVKKQIKEFKEKYHFTYSGMHKSLIWFFEIKQNPMDKSKGIGIIPYIYNDANQYYYAIFLAKTQNQVNKDINNPITTIEIPSPRVNRPTFLIDFYIGEDD